VPHIPELPCSEQSISKWEQQNVLGGEKKNNWGMVWVKSLMAKLLPWNYVNGNKVKAQNEKSLKQFDIWFACLLGPDSQPSCLKIYRVFCAPQFINTRIKPSWFWIYSTLLSCHTFFSFYFWSGLNYGYNKSSPQLQPTSRSNSHWKSYGKVGKMRRSEDRGT